MGTVRYTVVNGQVIAENRNGVRKTYVPDPSGSTIALLDDKQKITDTFSYSPFGELKSRTGTTPTPFQYIGTRGYYTDPNNRIYVRARTYQPNYARWMTVDPLWPGESAYGYARGNPVRWVDLQGTYVLRFDPDFWNKSGVVERNNCYNYACNDPGNDYRQPGGISGRKYNNMPNPPHFSCNNLLQNAIRDGLIPIDPIKYKKKGCPPKWHKVCLYISDDGDFSDFHWYRRDSDGSWSNKPGGQNISRCYLGTNIPITNPDIDAPLRGYEKKCGCLCAKDKPWNRF
jgi:RHS repeat-associated protein